MCAALNPTEEIKKTFPVPFGLSYELTLGETSLKAKLKVTNPSEKGSDALKFQSLVRPPLPPPPPPSCGSDEVDEILSVARPEEEERGSGVGVGEGVVEVRVSGSGEDSAPGVEGEEESEWCDERVKEGGRSAGLAEVEVVRLRDVELVLGEEEEECVKSAS